MKLLLTKKSLTVCRNFARTNADPPEQAMFKPHDNLGYSAYNKMIESFENNLFESQWNSEGDVCTIIENLADARRAASIYLNENSRLLSDKIGIG